MSKATKPSTKPRLDRQHRNASGEPKHSFPSRAAALAARRNMKMSRVNVYKCPVCGHWHTGRSDYR